jgi:hypothetical protein
MGRKSSIDQLPPELREVLDRLIREKRHTLDTIVAHLQALGGDVKRTAVGDYRQRMEKRLARYRDAQEVAGVWVAELGQQPESKTGQLLAELLKTVAFRTLAEMQEQEAGAEPEELMLLAKTLKDVATSQKTDLDFRQRVRAEYQAEVRARAEAAATEAKQVAAREGLTDEAAARIREIVLGVVG